MQQPAVCMGIGRLRVRRQRQGLCSGRRLLLQRMLLVCGVPPKENAAAVRVTFMRPSGQLVTARGRVVSKSRNVRRAGNRIVTARLANGFRAKTRLNCSSAKTENKNRYSSYGVFTGNKLVHYATLTEAEKARLPEAQQTYAVGAEVAATNASTGVLAENVSVTSTYCSTGYEMGCTKAASIYSGAYFGTLGSTADHKMLQEACGSYEPDKTVVPTISFRAVPSPTPIRVRPAFISTVRN